MRYWREDAEIENPRGYLLTIALNESRNYRSSARHRMPHEPEWLDELIADATAEPANIMLDDEKRRAVWAAVKTLRPRQQQILTLHIVEQMTNGQIAVRLGLSPRTVLRDLVRAYAKLRILLVREDPEVAFPD